MKKLTVLFDANPMVNQKTGVGYLTESLIAAVARNSKREVRMIGFYFNFLGKKDTSHIRAIPGLEFIEIRFFPTKLLNALRKIGIELPVELFTKKRADVLLFSNFVSLPSLFRTKNVLFVHDTSFEDVPQYAADKNASFLRRYVPRSIKRASAIVTISEFSAERISELYHPSVPIQVMNVPPNISTAKDDTIFKTFSIPDAYILFMGTLEPRKNLSLLLDAYPETYAKTGCALVIAGGRGWKNEQLQQQIDVLTQKSLPIILTGYISDEQRTSLYQKARLYVQPSHYEGFGMPLLEAMACGTPVLCSDIPVFHEVAKDAAEYFNKEDPSQLAKKMIAILSDNKKRAALQQKSKTHIAQYETWDATAQKIIDTITQVANN